MAMLFRLTGPGAAKLVFKRSAYRKVSDEGWKL